MNTYVVTVTAADQVGIVQAVTGAVKERGGNVLELSQTVMQDFFTIILAAEFPNAQETRELAEFVARAGERFKLTVAVLEAGNVPKPNAVVDGERFILTVLGNDCPGIIHLIAGCLAEHGVNIVDLHARSVQGRFSLVMEAFLPPSLPPNTLRTELDRFGKELGLEAYVQHENLFLATSEPSPVRVGPGRDPQGSRSVVPH
jgi:glycine cleavage system transcriptional repressor